MALWMLLGAAIGMLAGWWLAKWREQDVPASAQAVEDGIQQGEIERVLAALPEASVVVDGSGAPVRMSNQALAMTLIQNGRIAIPEISSMIADVRHDGEIREHRWATPAQVVSMRDTGEIELAPPTFITLRQLMQHAEVASVLDAATQREQARTIEHFATRVVTHDGGWTAVYHGDTLYEYAGGHGATSAGLSSAPGEVTALDLEAAGPRHRLLMAEQWSYIRQGC